MTLSNADIKAIVDKFWNNIIALTVAKFLGLK
jgi:hypothetical protein